MMKKTMIIIGLLMATIVTLTGCGSGDDDTPTPSTPVNPDNPNATYTLSLSPTSLSFEAEGGQQSVSVTTNASAWTVESSQSWCKAEKNGDKVNVTAEANTTQQQRTATITVKITDSNQQQTINVTQANAAGQYCTTNMPDVWVFSKSSSFTSFALQTNIDDFTVSSSESWCTAAVQPSETSNQRLLVVNVTEYDLRNNGEVVYGEPRKAVVRITCKDIFDRSITIIQNTHVQITTPQLPSNGFGYYLKLSSEGESRDVTVKSNGYAWDVMTEDTWLTVTKKDATTLTVTSTARTDGTPRSGKVTIFDTSDYNSNLIFTVADKDADLTGDDYHYGEGTQWD